MKSVQIVSVQVGEVKEHLFDDPRDGNESRWTSGIFKSEIIGSVFFGHHNVEGDGQADLVYHGGPDRAVLLYPQPHYDLWQSELGERFPNGGFGENLTLSDSDENEVCLGDIWSAKRGSVVLEVSQPRIPCFKLGRRLSRPELPNLVMQAMNGGWYARVLVEGVTGAGDELVLESRPFPSWTIRKAFHELIFGKDNGELLQELRAIPCLSTLWKTNIARKLEKLT